MAAFRTKISTLPQQHTGIASIEVIKRPVLLVGNFLASKTGNHTLCEDLAVRLSNLGWPVLKTSNKASRIPRLLHMLKVAWRKRDAYSVALVDVYSGFAFGWAEAVCFVLRMVGKPYALMLRGGNLPTFAQRWPRRVKWLLCSADIVLAPSQFLCHQMSSFRADIREQPNPLNLALYPFRFRTQLKPNLMWLRAFHGIYNPSLAPKVVALLAADFPEVRLTMVGPDKGDGSLDEMWTTAKALGVAERITVSGGVRKEAVPQWLAQGDIFLNTTNIDNTPISVLEAMACGLCVVSTNVGGLTYLLENEREALLVPPNDAAAMAAAIRRLLTQHETAALLSLSGRRKVEPLDWSRLEPEWEKLLNALLEKGCARPGFLRSAWTNV